MGIKKKMTRGRDREKLNEEEDDRFMEEEEEKVEEEEKDVSISTRSGLPDPEIVEN